MVQHYANMTVAGYVRVSTKQQKEDGSHETQREKLREWADREGQEIELFEDIAISGQSDERAAYQRLMDRAEEFDAIVVRELSRFGRSLRQVLNDVHELSERGVDFISIKDQFDTSTAQGKLMMHMIGAFNQFWADLARERANEMVQRRREQGKPIGRPKKVNNDQLDDVRDWRERGMSYNEIRVLLKEIHDVEVDRTTVYRYCQEAEA